ncbi:MAG: pilus assembly PilX family protein [Wenzhouxiangella sp.]
MRLILNTTRKLSRGQRGSALLVALIFLLILTLLGLAAANTSIMQERMASNVSEYNIAFQNAEAVLREVEFRLRQPVPGITTVAWGDVGALVGRPGDCSLETTLGADWESLTNGLNWVNAPSAPGQYVVIELSEYLDSDANRRVSCRLEDGLTLESGVPVQGEHYLILARAFGPGAGNRRARALVQSIFWWPR